MENLIARRVRLRMAACGLNAHQADKKAGLTPGFTADLIGGRKVQPRPAHMAKLAEALECDLEYLMLYQRAPRKGGIPEDGLPMLGVCEPGVWREEMPGPAESTPSPYEPDPRYAEEDQGVYTVRGPHAEPLGLQSETVLIALLKDGISKTGYAFKPGDIVVIRRGQGKNLFERSVGQVETKAEDKISIRRASGEPADDGEIEALALTAIRHL